eukprot:4066536-Ditylum_brightwellii.AAC.1
MEQTLVANNKRLCQQKDKTIQHIMSGCNKLEGSKYMKQHNKVVQYIHWNILCKQGIPVHLQWYKHSPTPSVIDDNTTITWDLMMVVDKALEHNWPNIVILDKVNETAKIIDIAVLYDTNMIQNIPDFIVQQTAVLGTAHVIYHMLTDSVNC